MYKLMRYLIQNQLGAGGMGAVFRVTDRITGKTVALKQVTTFDKLHISVSSAPGATEADLLYALAHEFQTLASLRHPHIISVLDYGFDADKQPFFTMDYLPGAQTLLEAGQTASLERKIELLQQVLQALAYLHRRDILHRDLKPENALVSNGKVRVLDFGLSASRGSDTDPRGTYLYLAPEVWQKQPYTAAADLFAVGVLAYQLLTGEHPFGTFDHAFVDRVIDGEPNLQALATQASLQAVIARLLAKDPTERYTSAQDAQAALSMALGQPIPEETEAIRESYLQAATFVGREQEMAQLREALVRAVAGQGSAWLIGGESGVGKTRLLDELRIHALVEGCLVLRGQGVREGGGLPYQLWREPLRHLLAITPEVDDLTASVLLPLVPEIETLLDRKVFPAPPLDEKSARERLFSTLVHLFRQQEHPILLILEDLQWTQESLAPLSYLLRQLTSMPMLLLGSYREDESPDLPESLPEMQMLSLPRLSPEAMAELSAAMLGEVGVQPEVLALLQRETEGNAFFAVEVVRALAEEAGRLDEIGQMILPETLLPEGVQTIVQRRLARVPEKAYPLLQLTAVAGRELDLALIQALASGIRLYDWWLPVCAETAVLEVQNGRWQFSHGKIRDGLLAMIDPETMIAHHRKVAQAVEQIYPDDLNQSARLVFHWGQAGNQEQERQYAFLAGQHASSRYTNTEAVMFFSRALELTPDTDWEERFDILFAREKVYDLIGKRDRQQQDLTELASLAEEIGGPKKQIEVILRQAEYSLSMGDYPAALQAAQKAIDQAGVAGEDGCLAGGYRVKGTAYLRQGEHKAALEAVEISLTLYRKLGNLQEEGDALQNLGVINWYMADFDQAREYFRQSYENARQSENQMLEGRALSALGVAARSKGDYDQAQDYYQQALTIAQAIGYQHLEGQVLNNLGVVWLNLGLNNQAQSIFEQGLAMGQEMNNMALECSFLNNLGAVSVGQGAYSQAQIYYQGALDLNQRLGQQRGISFTLNRLAYLAYMQEAWEDAYQYYHQSQELAREMEYTQNLIESQAGIAAILLAQGEEDQAFIQIEPVVQYLLEHDLEEGYWSPLQASLFVYQILSAKGEEERAQIILEKAYKFVQENADKIENDEMRRSFLENVHEHRDICQAYRQLQPDSLPDSLAAEPEFADALDEVEIEHLEEQTPTSDDKLRGEALLSHLLAVSRRMAETRTLDPLLSYAIDEVLKLVGAERGYIVLLQRDGSLDFRVVRHADGSDFVDDVDPISHSVLDEVIETQQSVLVRNAVMDPRFGNAQSVMIMKLRSIMCVPLLMQSRIIGAIYVENRAEAGRFSQEDLAPLEFFSNQAAVAIENANIHENLEQLVAERTWELAEAKEAAEGANQAKTTFLSNMSHELRTPLNAILNFAGFVYDGFYGQINPKQQEALQQVLDSGEHLLSLINDVLDLNKIEAGMINLVFEEVDISKILNHMISTTKGLLKDQPIELVTDIQDNLPLISADKRRMRQIFLNIISNAVNYTVEGQITIRASSVDDWIEVSIQDTGIGISKQDHDLVFETYQQASQNPENVVSTGLGLPITKNLVTLHGGQIWFESEIGEGTTFYLRLPIEAGPQRNHG